MKDARSNSFRDRERARIHGVTMIELLLVLIIVSLLSTLAVPTVIRHQRNARIATAKTEIRNLAMAEEMVAMHFDIYVPLQWLDDAPANPLTTVDDIDNEPRGTLVAGGALLVSTLLPTSNQIGSQLDFETGIRRVDRLVSEWEGPFIQFQRFWQKNNFPTDPQTLRLDFPFDPWGNPYIFYSASGVIGEGAAAMAVSDTPPLTADWDGSTTTGLERFSNGVLTTQDDRFDRYAIVSFGPDGIRNSRLLSAGQPFGDDVIRFFGDVAPETIL